VDKFAVTSISTAAIVVAIAISLRWGRLDQSVRLERGGPIARALRRLAVLVVSGVVAGLLVGGLGSRLMMRIMAATSSATAQGRVTEAGQIVGRVTSDGTGGLLIFVGLLFGLFGVALYWVLGRFLPRSAWVAGLVLGLFVLGAFARRDPLSPDNRDFTILQPVLLAVVIIVALFLLYGTTLVALAARLERAYPAFEARPLSLVSHAPLLLLAFPPLPLALLAAIFIGALNARFPQVPNAWRSETVGKVGFALIGIGTVVGNVWLGLGVADILA
jgi:hypothetical protein